MSERVQPKAKGKGKAGKRQTKIGLDLNPGQERAFVVLQGPQRHTCLVGGSRSGKTTLIVNALLVRGVHAPGSRHAILRQHKNAAVHSITLDTLPKVAKMRFPGMELTPHRQDGYFAMPNGSEIWIGGLDDPERVDKILGREYASIFYNEVSQIKYSSVLTAQTRLAQVVTMTGSNTPLSQRNYYDLNPIGKGHWSNVLFGDKRDPISRLPLPDPENYARCFLNPKDNEKNLTLDYIRSLENLPLRQRQRFFEGVYVDELEGALWTYEAFELGRVDELPVDNRRRVVVAVDPSGASSKEDESRDEIGIVVAALGTDAHGYILADRSLRDSPAIWGKRVVEAFHDFGADSIVAEQNFGGEMVKAVIRAADPQVPVKLVTASRGKMVRAEPVSALYGDPPEFKNIRIHHVGRFPALEDQMVACTTAGYQGEGSPDKCDALVWAISELMLTNSAEAWISYMAKQAEIAQGQINTKKPDRPIVDDDPTKDITNSVVETYRRITGKEAAKQKQVICGWCDEPVGKSRASDGESVYHEDCYHLMLKSGKKVSA
jgi:terminase large subunit-like protein